MVKLYNQWETINTTARRLKVQGGWVVEVINTTANTSAAVFISDPTHEWETAATGEDE